MRPILIGIAQALVFKKSFYTPTTDNNIFSKKMRAIIKFSNLIVIPSRKILDLDQIPQVRKTTLFSLDKKRDHLQYKSNFVGEN